MIGKIKKYVVYLYFLLGNFVFFIDGELKDIIKYLLVLEAILILINVYYKKIIRINIFVIKYKYIILYFLVLIFLFKSFSNFILSMMYICLFLTTLFLAKYKINYIFFKRILFISLILSILLFMASPKYIDEIKEIFILKFYRKIPLPMKFGYLNYSTYNIFLVLCGIIFNSLLIKGVVLCLLIYTAKTSTIAVFLFAIFINKSSIKFFKKNFKKILFFYFGIVVIIVFLANKNFFSELNQGLNGRIELWCEYIKYFYNSSILNKIIGNGWNTSVIRQYGKLKHPHNEYLQVLINFGIVGFIYFINLIIQSLKNINNITELKIIVSLILLMTIDCNLVFNFSPFVLYLLLYYKNNKNLME